jgi:hypothetical protein
MKHMDSYTKIREKSNYKKLDTIVYGSSVGYEDPLPMIKQSNETTLEYTTRIAYLTGFMDIQEKVGDTDISLDKTTIEFFDDNVIRYIEHDKLHEHVAIKYRDTTDLIFSDLQEDKNSVALSKAIFMRMTNDKILQMLKEEIVVLFLERKWIPELVKCYKETDTPYVEYNKNIKKEELKEIIVHFTTNLCGQEHHWLRRYCLDHYKFLMNIENYDLEMIKDIATSVADVKTVQSIVKYTFPNFMKTVLNNNNNLEYMEHFEIYTKHYESVEPIDIEIMGGGGDDITEVVCFDINNLHRPKTKIRLSIPYLGDYGNQIIEKMIGRILLRGERNDFTGEYYDFIIYDMDKNIGLNYDRSRSRVILTAFYFNVHYEEKHLKIVGQKFPLDNKNMKPISHENNYKKMYRRYYYYSTSCTEHEPNKENVGTSIYLSSYGTENMIKILEPLFEYIARDNMNIVVDDINNDIRDYQSCESTSDANDPYDYY